MNGSGPTAIRFLVGEAEGLLVRVRGTQPLSLRMSMVAAAEPAPAARRSIEHHLAERRLLLEERIRRYLVWLPRADPVQGQRRLTALRLSFNDWLAQYDLFADALVQRGDHQSGVLLAGLDRAAADVLTMADSPLAQVPVLCYLDRGPGASIRRISTRLPGGGRSPVAIVRVPRERMVGGGLSSSLAHEVGHQAAALLGLVTSIAPVIRGFQNSGRHEWRYAWTLWGRWLSEVAADFWAVAKLGVAATLGLMGLMSLPSAFVFRINPNDPHPAPWIRVRLSCALGEALYPHPQWNQLRQAWSAFYPPERSAPASGRSFAALDASITPLVALLLHHRPRSLHGRSVPEALQIAERQPAHLRAAYQSWGRDTRRMSRAAPTLVLAALGHQRIINGLDARTEGRLVSDLLRHWALQGAEEAWRAPRRVLLEHSHFEKESVS